MANTAFHGLNGWVLAIEMAAGTAAVIWHCSSAVASLLLAVVLLLGLWVLLLRGPRTSSSYPKTEKPSAAAATDEIGASPAEMGNLKHQGPVRWSFMPSNGILCCNTREPMAFENENASVKALVLHRPTHDADCEAAGQYPYAWHFHGRKRIWEVRVQIRFKRLPKGKICFGLEMRPAEGHQKTFLTQQVQRTLVGAMRAAIGNDIYHTPGDDPASTEGEVESPAFVMPLWAVDQFHVAVPGQEPLLSANLDRIGMKRTDSVRAYIEAMRVTTENLSCDKVYTFCVWGVSPFVDVSTWELKGLWPGFKMDAAKLSGDPLVYVAAYDLEETRDQSQRHLESCKSYYFKVALWSTLKPPKAELLPMQTEQEQQTKASAKREAKEQMLQRKRALDRLLRWTCVCGA
eukprot:TRINITY_DN43733_c0_g1_i1.p1 TRINITY_DN43733_c0_g1~~TRINITY_DN43733_c0_g1_i1.p1  ORF type:complete len:414 (+),score=76.59 TRINITY_DN43733_c0_g1_i1:35-1243(+)